MGRDISFYGLLEEMDWRVNIWLGLSTAGSKCRLMGRCFQVATAVGQERNRVEAPHIRTNKHNNKNLSAVL
jgi:hypothetical protein